MRARPAIVASVVLGIVTAGLWSTVPSLRDDTLAALAVATLQQNSVPAEALDEASPGDVSVYLVVGSDRRDEAAGHDPGVQGERADAVMLWAVPASGAVTVLSLPRDIRVHVPGHGDSKLHGVLAYGADALVAAVRSLTGIPVHHYLEIEFAGLRTVVDGLGGIPMALPRPAWDPAVGLDLPGGAQVLDGEAALAYVRSRHYAEFGTAGWTISAPGDLGRIDRQHLLLGSLLTTLRSRCSPLSCLSVLRSLGRSLTVDEAFDGEDVQQLVTALWRTDAALSAATLPTRPERAADDSLSPFPPTHVGNLGFRELDEPAAGAVLDRLRAGVSGRAGAP